MQQVSRKYIESFKERKLLKAEDIASILNISTGFAYQLMKRGDVPTVHLGRAVRVRPSDLKDYMQSRTNSKEVNPNLSHREVYLRNEENND